MKTIHAMTALVLLTLAAPVAQAATHSVKDGVDAWSNGDYAAAVRTWEPLAQKGDADALFNLAQAYKLGRGVPLDLSSAERLYGQAAEKGHVQAADAYGLLLFQEGERERALPYLQASAARGDPRAMYILGVAHFNGDLVAKDWVRAYALASLARQAGLPQAAEALARMDEHVPLADRQKSVVVAEQISAQAQANRERLNTAVELDTRLAQAEPVARPPSPPRSPKPAPQITAAAKPKEPPAPPVAKKKASGPWRVQLGAFAVAGNAETLWSRLKGRPELAGHPRALVRVGKLTKLQATGFASRAEASAACARLSAGGFTCLPSRD
ncbi:SPOR domain-containing protein [Novosphingobium panipatense]